MLVLVVVAMTRGSASSHYYWIFRSADDAAPPIPKQPIRIFGPTDAESRTIPYNMYDNHRAVHHQLISRDDQWLFLQSRRGRKCWSNIKERYLELSRPYQLELFKYCYIVSGQGNVYQDEGMSWLVDPLEFLKPHQTLVIQADANGNGNGNENDASSPEALSYYYHSSFLQLHNKQVAWRMVQFLMETPLKTLEASPLLLPAKLYELTQSIRKVEYQSVCRTPRTTTTMVDAEAATTKTLRAQPCSLPGGFCCQVVHDNQILAALHHPILSPSFHNVQRLPNEKDSFVSTITVHPTGNEPATPFATPNFFDILLHNDCFPTTKSCYKCLKRPTSSCIECAEECGCYCQKALCQLRPPPKVVTEIWHVHPPRHRRQERLIPRLVHQTWFEPVTPDKYPNMSRLIESWKQSGWEYTFYDDASAATFLSQHFPPQVRDAYDAILPGAFKADLFRYCVLLIKGGIYADMDLLLESNLDAVLPPDLGFLVPIDEPGSAVGHRSCLWNGLLAVAPGHPFMARTIQRVVNNIRNRFTSVDYDDMLCPNPILSVSHTVDTLFTCGPCILGAAMNEVLGRHMQTEWEIGEVNVWSVKSSSSSSGSGSGSRTNTAKGVDGRLYQYESKNDDNNDDDTNTDNDDPRHAIPGRTVILAQNKNDMGAHRFTWASRNIMVAATDMPNYDDRPPTKQHYSRTHEKTGVYGLRNLYRDAIKANEEIRIVVKQT